MEKWTKYLNRRFTKAYTKSPNLNTCEKVFTLTSYHGNKNPTRVAKMRWRRKDNINCCGATGMFIPWEFKMVNYSEKLLSRILQIWINAYVRYDNFSLRYLSNRNVLCSSKIKALTMFKATLLVISPNWLPHKCPGWTFKAKRPNYENQLVLTTPYPGCHCSSHVLDALVCRTFFIWPLEISFAFLWAWICT